MRVRSIALAAIALLLIAACKKNSTEPDVDERVVRSSSSASM
jgi:hypothetical protein